MGGLIFIIIGFLVTLVFGMKIGIEMAANELYEQHRINGSEREYMQSWDYLTDILQNGIQKRE